MKLHLLISTVLLGATVLVRAQTGGPDTFLLVQAETVPPLQAPTPDVAQRAAARKPHVDADGTLHLSAGPLVEVVAQIELCLPDLKKYGKNDWTMPNVIYDDKTGTRDATVPANLRLRKVTPVQALALAAAAAGCTLETIFAPDEHQDAPRPPMPMVSDADVPAGSRPVIGYRIVQSANQTRSGDIGGIGITLVKKDGKTSVGEVLPGSPADRSSAIKPGDLILSVGENRSSHVAVGDMPLQEVAERLRGTRGSPVELDLQSAQPGKGKVQVELVRGKLNWPAPKPGIGLRETPVQIINSSGEEVIGMASPASKGPFLLLEGAEGAISLVPASSAQGRVPGSSGNSATPPGDGEVVVRVYATGSLFSGSEKESLERQKEFMNLVMDALQRAGVNRDRSPIEAIHETSKALIAKGTAVEHAIIQQIIAVMKENEAEAAGGKATKR